MLWPSSCGISRSWGACRQAVFGQRLPFWYWRSQTDSSTGALVSSRSRACKHGHSHAELIQIIAPPLGIATRSSSSGPAYECREWIRRRHARASAPSHPGFIYRSRSRVWKRWPAGHAPRSPTRRTHPRERLMIVFSLSGCREV